MKLCSCHGEPMCWQKDTRRPSGGHWYCRVKHREREQTRYQRDPEAKRDSVRAYWHRADGGYINRRRRQLAEQRTQILQRLAELRQEAEDLVES